MIPEEVKTAIANNTEMMEKINVKKKKFQEEIDKIQNQLNELHEKYIGRSQTFIEDKRKELTDKLKQKQELIQSEIDRLTKIADDWLKSKKDQLIKKSADAELKVKTGIDSPSFDEIDL